MREEIGGRHFSKSPWVFIKSMSLRQSRVFSSHPLGFLHMAMEWLSQFILHTSYFIFLEWLSGSKAVLMIILPDGASGKTVEAASSLHLNTTFSTGNMASDGGIWEKMYMVSDNLCASHLLLSRRAHAAFEFKQTESKMRGFNLFWICGVLCNLASWWVSVNAHPTSKPFSQSLTCLIHTVSWCWRRK